MVWVTMMSVQAAGLCWRKNPPVTVANKSLFSGFPTKNITILTVLGGGVKPRYDFFFEDLSTIFAYQSILLSEKYRFLFLCVFIYTSQRSEHAPFKRCGTKPFLSGRIFW